MESPSPRPVRGLSPLAGNHPLWLLALLLLLGWHVWRTLGLFGPEHLLDDQPLLSGRHPLHLYHGYLGARSLRERGSPSCYDPAFHAGYPKTPVFDGGSRPAEVALYLAGAVNHPAPYKVLAALIWGFAPAFFWLAARSAGLVRADAVLAVLLGLLLWWGGPCRQLLDAGDLDLLLAATLVLVQTGLLLRYHQQPGPGSLLGICVTSMVGWFVYPLLMALLYPLFLVYYLTVGARHPLTWHVALSGGLLAALAVNGFWLFDWVLYWWIRLPPELEVGLRPGWSLRAVWNAELWGGAADRVLAALLLSAGAVGVYLYNGVGRRAAARLFGLGAGGFLTLAALGLIWDPLGRLGATQLLAPALLFAIVPAAHALATTLRIAGRLGLGLPAAALALAGAGAVVWLLSPTTLTQPETMLQTKPLPTGLGSKHAQVIEMLRCRTTPTARILWEDRRGGRRDSRWTALLPLLTERAYIGGLDPEAGIEHAASGLTDQALAGKPLDGWSDEQLSAYCDLYNVGWVMCWTRRTIQRFQEWERSGAVESLETLEDPDGAGAGRLFVVRRRHSFARVGAVGAMNADARRIVLSDVTPENGVVVLSLHHQAGMRVTPGRVRLEAPEAVVVGYDSIDSIGFVRLRLDEYTPRITLTWERR
jgi:hypothetical protein